MSAYQNLPPKLSTLYADALQNITPDPDTGGVMVGNNHALAICCATIVLARHIEMLTEAVRGCEASLDAGLPR